MSRIVSRDLEERLVAKALRDPAFKHDLLHTPRATISRELGEALPADADVKVVEETATTQYIVLPDLGSLPFSVELGESMIAAVTGGAKPKSEQCSANSYCC